MTLPLQQSIATMKSSRRHTVPILIAFLLATPILAEETWKAGTARTDITPRASVPMAGYASRTRPAKDALTPLWAKALVLEDAQGERGLILTLDLVGIDRTLSQSICDQLRQTHQLARDQIAICLSHTHTGPVVGRNLAPMHYRLVPEAQQTAIDDYAKTLRTTLIELVGRAINDLEPCRLKRGIGTCTFAVNRRNNRPEDEVAERRTRGTLQGPEDHDVPVLSIRNAEGALKSVLFGYACHATVLSLELWSGDYPGFAQLELERLYPKCQAMFWAGCGADQNPLPRRTVELAKHYGRRLANAVDATMMTSQMKEVTSKLETSYSEIALPLDELPTIETIELAAKSTNRYEQSRARMLLAQISGGNELAQTYPYPIGVWKLGGDVNWVQLGGEVVVDYALRLKAEMGRSLWVAGYANDVMAYIPSRRVLREGGYEGATSMVYYGLPTTWAPTIENAIIDEVARQVGRNR